MNIKDIKIALKLNKKEITKYGISQLKIFGSYVKNKQNDQSDVDFLVKFKKNQKTYKNFINLNYFLEDILGKKVELVTEESLSPYIGPYIVKEAENVI